MKFVLYHMPGSRSQRVRWMLEELECTYQVREMDLFKGDGNTAEFRAMHPLGQLPVLTIDGKPMFESGAIIHWLADIHSRQQLSPEINSSLRRDFNQWMYFAVTSLEAPAWDIVLHGKILTDERAVKTIIPYSRQALLTVFGVLENELSDKKTIVGNTFTAADILIGYILMWFPDELAEFPNLKSYVHSLQHRPAYRRSMGN